MRRSEIVAMLLVLMLCGCESAGSTRAKVRVGGFGINRPAIPIEISPDLGGVSRNDIRWSGVFDLDQTIDVSGPVMLVPAKPLGRRPTTMPADDSGHPRVLGRLLWRSGSEVAIEGTVQRAGKYGVPEIVYPTVGTLPVTIDGKPASWKHLQPGRWVVIITDATTRPPTALRVIEVDE